MEYKVIEDENTKALQSNTYNYYMQKESGLFFRWGKILNDDPLFSPYGPEILDLEISSGKCMVGCDFCYKKNGIDSEYHNMNFDTFKIVFDKIKKSNSLTQIAFGITDIAGNPDFFKMMEYSKENGIAPNYTCHGFDTTLEIAKRTAELCGAVAVSCYDIDKTFESIKMFTTINLKEKIYVRKV